MFNVIILINYIIYISNICVYVYVIILVSRLVIIHCRLSSCLNHCCNRWPTATCSLAKGRGHVAVKCHAATIAVDFTTTTRRRCL